MKRPDRVPAEVWADMNWLDRLWVASFLWLAFATARVFGWWRR